MLNLFMENPLKEDLEESKIFLRRYQNCLQVYEHDVHEDIYTTCVRPRLERIRSLVSSVKETEVLEKFHRNKMEMAPPDIK